MNIVTHHHHSSELLSSKISHFLEGKLQVEIEQKYNQETLSIE